VEATGTLGYEVDPQAKGEKGTGGYHFYYIKHEGDSRLEEKHAYYATLTQSPIQQGLINVDS
jgi:hypothetical protein